MQLQRYEKKFNILLNLSFILTRNYVVPSIFLVVFNYVGKRFPQHLVMMTGNSKSC